MSAQPNRAIAAVDRILGDPNTAALIARHGRERVKAAIRALQAGWRSSGELPAWSNDSGAYRTALVKALQHRGYVPVFNLSGTLIHTNLGRAPLPASAWDAVRERMLGATNLEFDLKQGTRGQRENTVTERLCSLTGAPAATVVNNTAAALVIILNTFALGREVPVSRGELIEIGGSFRLPDIMRQAGCTLREVGTTNRTHRRDYAAAIGENTGMLLKVHPSNYHIEGFTSAAGIAELAQLARAHQLPLCEDLGSGTLVDLTRYGLPKEPTPDLSLKAGADLVTFSGDKLLGGVQAGIILGKPEYINAINANPLKRALRLDKVALNLLDEILKLYESPDGLEERIPVLRLLTTSPATLKARAGTLLPHIARWLPQCNVTIAEANSQIGSGALPDAALPSFCVRIAGAPTAQLKNILKRLRALPTPVIGRLQQGAVWLDMRGAEDIAGLCALFESAEP